MVEAKHRSRLVGIQDVTPFLNTAEDLLRRGSIQAAVLVSDGTISDKAHGAALNRPGVKLLTLQELQQDLFNYTESLLKSKLEYEASTVYGEYIPLRGRSEQTNKNTNDVVRLLLNWANGANEPMIVLTGDFGSGKTTLLKRVFYDRRAGALPIPTLGFLSFFDWANFFNMRTCGALFPRRSGTTVSISTERHLRVPVARRKIRTLSGRI